MNTWVSSALVATGSALAKGGHLLWAEWEGRISEPAVLTETGAHKDMRLWEPCIELENRSSIRA
jgi:hypothetical protein